VLSYAVPFLILLGVVVFVHEYGHYIVGRWCGIGARVFSIGFGKPLYAWTDRRGTQWQVAALPLGGFVKFVGDMDPASAGKIKGPQDAADQADADDDDEPVLSAEELKVAFHMAPLWKRAATVVAGPVFNFILSIVIFAGIALTSGQSTNVPLIGAVTDELPDTVPLRAGDRVIAVGGVEVDTYRLMVEEIYRADGAPTTVRLERDGEQIDVEIVYPLPTEVNFARPGDPASGAGIVVDDVITKINDLEVSSFQQIRLATRELTPGAPVDVTVLRDGEEMVFTFVPEMIPRMDPVTGERDVPQPTLGISFQGAGGLQPGRESVGPITAVWSGVQSTVNVVTVTVNFLGDIIFEDAPAEQIGGPIGIAQVAKQQAERGIGDLIVLVAFLSTSIGMLNLMPIPVLDGGHLMFFSAEAVRGRPVSERIQEYGTAIGLSLVLLLMVFATYNDIVRLIEA
ncbi:MAG: RIP metalloprotease RseP, partial [Pseudomonadota bacterium]